MASAKKELRRQVAAALRAQDGAELERQSRRVAERVCALPEFAAARSLSVYLAMPREAATEELLAAAFAADRKVFVPKITGRGAEDMCMLHARSLEDVAAFPKDNWEIPDPPLLHADGSSRDDALETLELELVLLPGVAFDRAGGRLGHGKGYYAMAVAKRVAFLLCVCLLAAATAAQDLYELLGVSASASPAQMKKAYRKLSLKYHPDKQTVENGAEAREKFVKITNAYRVLSDPARREKYDVYGIADEQGFKNFDEALRFSHEGVEDSLVNWLGLVAILAVGIVPILIMQRNRTKPLKKRRETFKKDFTTTRREYVDNPFDHED
ncbi:hypothetical protein PybrP1_006316 [[Pythium] brassicae (nom. inval.)]|nr:hypothetical protein PybrP1_006316 [[Pythium] brassicae (nom. inval.)]